MDSAKQSNKKKKALKPLQNKDFRACGGEGETPHQKHGRLTRLERIVILPVSSPHRLASSSAGRASAVRPAPEPAHSFSSSINKNRHPKGCLFLFGGEGETRTLAPVTRPTPLAGAPRHQLEYFSIGNNSRCYLIL